MQQRKIPMPLDFYQEGFIADVTRLADIRRLFWEICVLNAIKPKSAAGLSYYRQFLKGCVDREKGSKK